MTGGMPSARSTYLVPVNVTAEKGRGVARQFRTRDHVRTALERKVSGTAGRAVDAVVQAQEPYSARGSAAETCTGWRL